MDADFTAAERANFVAAHVVAAATAFLDGRYTATDMADKANALMRDINKIGDDAAARRILVPTMLLAMAMLGTAAVHGAERQERWRDLMAALVRMVRFESIDLRETGAQRS